MLTVKTEEKILHNNRPDANSFVSIVKLQKLTENCTNIFNPRALHS